MRKNKIKNTSNNPAFAQKSAEEWDQYLDVHSFQMMPMNGAGKKRLAIEMIKFFEENKDALFFNDFLDVKGMCESDMYRWCDKEPDLKLARERAFDIIARRRERGAIKKEYAERTIHFMMPHYSKDWAAQQERAAKLSIKEDAPASYTVIKQYYGEKEEDETTDVHDMQ